ncbi:MAG: MBL fold metallo-hydrolase [Thomasclavelia ramosa]
MEKVIILGTGNAGVKNCYNTCFALKNKNDYLLVDAGGGNGILKQLELAKIELSQITNMIVTHSHTDHVLGVVWIFRMVATKIKSGEYDGNFNIYCHDELVSTIKTIIKLTVQERLYNLIDERIFINEVQDGQKITICEHLVTFFDIYSTKAKQFGFSIELDDGKLTCLGDEPFNELCYQYAVDSKWLLSEAFCLYQERDFLSHTKSIIQQ